MINLLFIIMTRLPLAVSMALLRQYSAKYTFLTLAFFCLPVFDCSAQIASSSVRQRVVGSTMQSLRRFATVKLSGAFDIEARDEIGAVRFSSHGELAVSRSLDGALIDRVKSIAGSNGVDINKRVQYIEYKSGDVLQLDVDLDVGLHPVSEDPIRGLLLFSKRLTGTQRIDTRKMYWGMNDIAAAVWVVGYVPLLDQLEQADNLEVVSSGAAYIIKAKSDFGALQLSVSEAEAWFPTHVTLVKLPSDQLMESTVAAAFAKDSDEIKSIRWDVTISGFEAIDSDSAPKRFDASRKTTRRSGEMIESRTSITLAQFTLSPKFGAGDFVPTVPIPVGTKVDVVDAKHLPFEWDGMKPVTTAPELLPSDFLAVQHASRRNWLTIFMGLLLISTLGWIYWRFRTRGGG